MSGESDRGVSAGERRNNTELDDPESANRKRAGENQDGRPFTVQGTRSVLAEPSPSEASPLRTAGWQPPPLHGVDQQDDADHVDSDGDGDGNGYRRVAPWIAPPTPDRVVGPLGLGGTKVILEQFARERAESTTG